MHLARILPAAFLVAGIALASPAARAAVVAAPFTEAAFQASQKAGKPILVEVTAPWCPVCAKQRPILSQLLADPEFKDLVVYNVDFDSQKNVLHDLGVRMQSTLIVFNGSMEKGRSTGVTDPAAISALLAKTTS